MKSAWTMEDVPVLDIKNPQVCLDLDIPIKNRSYGATGNIRAEALPEDSAPVADYLLSVIPNAKIEFLGRTRMLRLGRSSRRGDMPTSLFFDTVHRCFQWHYPLALRPEVLMHLIVNEVATTVNLYPEEYRHLFTASAEKVRINVRHDGLVLGDPANPWHEVLSAFGAGLEGYIPGTIMQNCLPRFSTATQETMAASMVAFMSAARQFYDYHLYTMCGLPRIRLLGNPTDYSRIYHAAEALSKYFGDHMGEYFGVLLPVLKTIEQQAQGAPVDEDFWRSIYKHDSMSGTDKFGGWLSAFVNYVQDFEPSRSGHRGREREWTVVPKEKYDWQERFGGIDIGSVPAQISTVPFIWHYFEQELPMQFAGGVLGVDNVDGYAAPALSFAVLHGS